jgi:uridine kinase
MKKKIVNIAEQISRHKDVKIILIAGPSSSGKTTFAKRLSIHLRVLGIIPKVIGMDDYFVSRHLSPIKENGEPDFESLKAIDVKLLNEHLTTLLSGKVIELPKYNFISGTSERSHKKMRIDKDEILILEGIHGLNDQLTASVPFNQKVKIYVSALNNLNIDSHNRIPTSDSRKLRRLVRDSNFRGHSAEQTLLMWDSVREGEEKNIFPFQENADFMFNSILTYEIGVIKKFAMPLLQQISEFSNQFASAQLLMNTLHHLHIIDENYVPTNSILREFIGNSVFKY